MIVGSITELKIVNVQSRGIPNKERIAISVNQDINLGQFGLVLGIFHDINSAFPLRDNFLWFGDGIVKTGDWIFVYTGTGEPTTSKLPGSQNDIFTVFWNRDVTILGQREVTPILMKVEAVEVFDQPNSIQEGNSNNMIKP